MIQLWVVRFSPIPTQPKYNFVEVFTVELFPKPNPNTSFYHVEQWRISLQSIAIVEGLKIKRGLTSYLITVEEKVGVEPTEPFDSTVFKTAALSHSANLPYLEQAMRFELTTSDLEGQRSTN